MYFLFYFKNTKNLFIHIACIPIGDSPRVHPNIFKMSPPFASSEGYSASGVRYQSDGECVTHLLLILDILASARGRVILRSHFLILLLLILLMSLYILTLFSPQ